MNSLFSRIIIIALLLVTLSQEAAAYMTPTRTRLPRSYITNAEPYRNIAYQNSGLSNGIACSFSNVSVGVGILSNGVNIMIDSPDANLTNCIKRQSWVSYFARFGNGVSLDTYYTTRGVQLVATSDENSTIDALKNTQWARIIQSQPRTSSYNQGLTYSEGYQYYPARDTYYYPENQHYQPYTYQPQPNFYTPTTPTWTRLPLTDRTYRAGSTIFTNYSQISRGIIYINNGVQMTFTSPDYRTMLYLQNFYYTGLFSDFSGISVNLVNIAGGVQVTVTSGSTSTIDEIQKIGYALVYR